VINDFTAEGPEELKQALVNLFEQSKIDPQFAEKAHFIHHKHGKQQSLLKINPPFHILHYDYLSGRSATEVVKNTIQDFIRDHCGENGYFEDVSRQDMLDRNRDFLTADGEKSRVVISEPMTLADARVRLNQASQVKEYSIKARDHFGLFQPSEQSSSQDSPSLSDLSKNKPEF